MQIEAISSTIDLLIHGGATGAIGIGVYVGIKVLNRLNRDESLRADYPPHRHVNEHVLYPKEYQPSEVGEIK